MPALGALFQVQGEKTPKVGEARDGDVVAVAKIDAVKAGQWLGAGKLPPPVDVGYPARNCAIAIEPADRKDDVKLSGALQRLSEEDCALVIEHDDANHEMRLRGVNDEHLNTVLARLKRRYGVEVKSHPPSVGYRESIRKPVTQKGRHKKQSGGHGQFGDVIIEVRPLPRGSGFVFEEKIHGGSVPKQWIPAVEEGVREAMDKGPLGFQVVDCAVTLIDGSYHSVDSSELAFRLAGRIAMQEALAAAQPAPARADAQADRRLPVERDQPDHFGGRRAARPDARHGAARRLDRLGPDRGADPRGRAVGPRSRASLAKPGPRDLRSRVRPSRRAQRAARRQGDPAKRCRSRRKRAQHSEAAAWRRASAMSKSGA